MSDRTPEDLGPQEIIDDLQADVAAALRENERLKAELAAALTGEMAAYREEFREICDDFVKREARIAERIDRWEADLKAENERRIDAELELATLRNLRVEFSLIRTENKLLKEELAPLRKLADAVETLRTAWKQDRDTASTRIEAAKEAILTALAEARK